MILDDFVMLGTTVPEPTSDSRVFVCSAGVSTELRRLIRIYPLARINAPSRWTMHRVRLERNPKDSRDESFRIVGDRAPGTHSLINERFEQVQGAIPKSGRESLLSRYVIGSIREANARRLSLAIVQPSAMELHFQANEKAPADMQQTLFDSGTGSESSGARRFPWMPRIRFMDECGWNDLMLRDWGTFELQRKHGASYFVQNLASALSLSEKSSLLVGNLNNQRNAWLVISILNGLRGDETLFDEFLERGTALLPEIRRAVYERDAWKCIRCGSQVQLTVQSSAIQPPAEAPSELESLSTLCTQCVFDR